MRDISAFVAGYVRKEFLANCRACGLPTKRRPVGSGTVLFPALILEGALAGLCKNETEF
jgi:hypothetical protein